MKKLLILLLHLSVFASTVHVTKLQYEGGISIFGKVGTANITFIKNLQNKSYNIKLSTSSVGIVKALSSNRKYFYKSEGTISNGVYIPHKFEKIMSKKNYIEKILYSFDYKNNKILKKTSKTALVKEQHFDAIKFKMITTNKMIKSQTKEYISLVKNDYLTLFLNLSAKKLKEGALHYVDQKESDTLTLLSPTLFEVSKHNGEKVYRIHIYNKQSKFFQKAVAIHIAFYGNAYVKKISEQSFSKD